MSQLLTHNRYPEAKSRPTALVRLLVMMAAIAVPIGFAGAQSSQLIFSDDFESGDFNSDWTEVDNFVVISDPTRERPSFVASVGDLSRELPAHLVKEELPLGDGSIVRVFFYDDGPQDGDDHSAGLDAGLESIGILARYSELSLPSSAEYYIFDPGGLTETTNSPRTVGWHEFRFAITDAGARAFIDGVPVGTVPLLTSADTFFIESEGGEEAYWDDVAIPPILAELIEVSLDIKPGSDPNSIDLKSKGNVPVAVLTTNDFNTSTVDPDTVFFAGASPVRWAMEDVDGDGDLDLLFHFKTQELSLDENSTEATLMGETFVGTPIQGTDGVNIVPKGQ